MAKNRARVRANPKQVAYKILYWNARGFSSKRSARYFRVYYGKKVVSDVIAFAPRHKTVAQKDKYLVRLLTEVEYKHQQLLAKRRRKFQIKKEAELKKKDEQKRKRAAAKAVKKQREKEEKYGVEIKKLDDFLKKEKLNTKKIRYETPTYKGFTNKVLKPVKITPVITGTPRYVKELLDKKVLSDKYGILNIKKLDFTLDKPIMMNNKNFSEVSEELPALFKPHLLKFFKQSKGTRMGFIFRIKYNMLMPPDEGHRKVWVSDQGVGGARFYVESIKYIDQFEILTQAAYGLLASLTAPRYLEKTINGQVDITGFTIETIVSGDYP